MISLFHRCCTVPLLTLPLQGFAVRFFVPPTLECKEETVKVRSHAIQLRLSSLLQKKNQKCNFKTNKNNCIYSTPLLPLWAHTRIRHIPGLPPDCLNLFLNINVLQLLHPDCFFRLGCPVPRPSCRNTFPALKFLGGNVVTASGVEEIVTLRCETLQVEYSIVCGDIGG